MVEYIAGQTIKISFEDNDTTWKTALPEIFQVSDVSSIHWTIDDTFLYEDETTFRSGVIGSNTNTTVDISFTLVSGGYIEFTYSGQSENNYDWLTVTLDNIQVLRVSGTRDWETFSQELDPGNHTIRFAYSKDRSGNVGLDAYAIGYIELSGVFPAFDSWYLIRNDDNDLFYKEVDGALEEVLIAEGGPTLEEFRLYGNDELPTTGLLTHVPRYTILKCVDTEDYQEYGDLLVATVQGSMKPTLMQLSSPVTLLDAYQIGFSLVQVNATHLSTTTLKFIISYDGLTWYAYENNTWEEVPYSATEVLLNGMTKEVLNSLGNTEYDQLYTAGIPLTMYIAFAISSTLLDDWAIQSIRITYKTDL